MVNLENISVCFGDKTVLNNISCSIEKGDFIVIVGPNGAGKTTLFDTIAGKCKPTHGSIIIDNKNVTHKNEQQRAAIIGRLFQNPMLNCVTNMTVAENVALSLCKGNRIGFTAGIDKKVQSKMKEIAALLNFDTEELAQKRMGSLSGGQRQTIALVMATFIKPKLLLLDEPTAALDPQAATKMLCFTTSYVKQHKLTTILITHDPQLAFSLGSKIWILEKGKLTKEITEKEKNNLSASDLIGHIDYEKIAKVARGRK